MAVIPIVIGALETLSTTFNGDCRKMQIRKQLPDHNTSKWFGLLGFMAYQPL